MCLRKLKSIIIRKSFKQDILAGPKEFTYIELKSAAKGFHSSMLIGKEAFGTVYKTFLTSSGTIAVMKILGDSNEGKIKFLAELSASLRHENLVQLIGWCIEKGDLLLVCDFMPNGSLEKTLCQKFGGPLLSWSPGYNILVDLASVLKSPSRM